MKLFLSLIFISLCLYLGGLGDLLSFSSIKEKQNWLLSMQELSPLSFALAYGLSYSLLTALSFPGLSLLTILAGFFFPPAIACLLVVFSASLGALVLFLIAKGAFQDFFRKKASPFLEKLQEHFEGNLVSNLFFLRLVPLFPFWLVNISAALFKVPTWTYFWTTFIGILPGSFAYTQAGRALAKAFESNEAFSLSLLITEESRMALLLLGLLALLPLILKRKKRA